LSEVSFGCGGINLNWVAELFGEEWSFSSWSWDWFRIFPEALFSNRAVSLSSNHVAWIISLSWSSILELISWNLPSAESSWWARILAGSHVKVSTGASHSSWGS